MSRWIILCVLVIGVTTAATIALQFMDENVGAPVPAARREAALGPPPKLVVADPKLFEFGTMSEQAERSKVWTVKNEGKGELRLTLIETSCTCTNVRFGDAKKKLETNEVTLIPPGESLDLHFAWKPKAGTRGEFSSNARFATNDFDGEPTIAFGVEGEVLASVVILPESIVFDEASSEESSKFSVAVFSPSMPDLRFTTPPTTSRAALISTEVKPMSPEMLKELAESDMKTETGYQLVVEVKPGMPLGRFRDALVIETNHPAMPRLEIPINGRVVGPISAMPTSVFLPGVSSKAGGEQVLTLTVRGQEATHFEVETPKDLIGLVDVRVEPAASEGDGKLRQYRMVVRVPPGAKAGKFSGAILLRTDHPGAAEVMIPVQAFVQAG